MKIRKALIIAFVGAIAAKAGSDVYDKLKGVDFTKKIDELRKRIGKTSEEV